MQEFWNEYNGAMSEFHKYMSRVYELDNLTPELTEKIVDTIVVQVVNELNRIRLKYAHVEGVPKIISRKAIIS